MALTINQGTLFDDKAKSYWRISDYRIYEQAKQGDIILSGYDSKQNFEAMEAAGEKSRDKTIVRITIPDFDTYFSRAALENEKIFSAMYRYTKLNGSGFEEAVDA